jgi:hypothetical protein
MIQIQAYLKQIYRLSLSAKKQEDKVWKDLKKIHQLAGWTSGIIVKFKMLYSKISIIFHLFLYDIGIYRAGIKI